MKQESERDDAGSKMDVVGARAKLKEAREASGKTPKDIAAAVGISSPAYYDLENCDGELNMAISLGQLSKLGSVLGIKPCFLFYGSTVATNSISVEQLIKKIRDYLTATGTSIGEFEDRVGFVIEPALRNPSEVLNWNVDCLRFVCQEIGVDWLAALP